MKIHHLEIALLIIVSSFCCDNKRTERSNNIDSLTSERSGSIDWDDKFQGSFIYHFMTDQAFQKERTGLEVKDLDYVNYFASKDYTLHIFTSFRYSNDKSLIKDLDKQNILSVIENEEFKTFTFSKDNKKWYLKSLSRSTFIPDSLKGFIGFLYAFSKDSSFRNSHIMFPLKFNYLDMEDLKDTTEYLDLKKASDFNFDLFTDRYFYFFHSGLDKIDQSDKISLLFRGIDNGIFVMYYFERKDDSWQLVEEDDYST